MTARGRAAVFAVALALLGATSAPSARAQCGAKRSTCSGCHDGTHAPYAADASWHRDHGFVDLCAMCHGGAPDAPLVADAHVGLTAPLAEDRASCTSCHGAASEALAQRYAPSATAAPDAGATPRPGSGAPRAPPDEGSNDMLAGAVAALLAVFGLAWVAKRELRTIRAWRDSWMHAVKMSRSKRREELRR